MSKTSIADGCRGALIEIEGETFLILSLPLGALDLSKLTPAERAVAEAMIDGKSNAEIAKLRGRSVRTIANQIASIFRKLGVGSRAELASRMIDRAEIEP